MKIFQKIIIIIIIVASIVGIAYLGYGYYQKLTTKIPNPVATIEVQDFGTIKVELYPDMAENTVTNFIKLANNEFYDGLKFHRIMKDFMIQGGDSNGDGTGSPSLSDLDSSVSSDDDKTYNIKGEFTANNYSKNTIKFEAGVLAMARSDYSSLSSSLKTQGYNSAGSQFFITTADSTNVNGLYAGFGKVIEGMDVVESIASIEVTTSSSSSTTADSPVNAPIITSIRVETYGVDYGMPETTDPFDYYNWLMQYYSSSSSSSN